MRKQGKILLVDDEEGILEVISTILGPHFEVIVTAKDGVEALRITETTQFEAILSDLTMPRMTGISLLKALRSKSDRTPFVILTGNGEQSTVLDALALDAFDYIDKPFNSTALIDTMKKAAELGRQLQIFGTEGIEGESLAQFYRENQIACKLRLQNALERYNSHSNSKKGD